MKTKKSTLYLTLFFAALGLLSSFVFGFFATIDSGTISSSEIDNISYIVDVQNDGTLIVEETLAYDADDINGIVRNYNYMANKNQKIEVESVTIDHRTEAQLVSYASKGDNNVFTFMDDGKNQEVKIFKQADGKIDFTIKYKAIGMITEYNDVQDLYWMFYDSQGESVPQKIDMVINFPQTIGTENMKIFGHGDVDGNLSISDDKTARVSISGFYTESFAEVRVLLPTKPLKNVTNKTNENQLTTILDYEVGEAEKTEQKIAQNAEKQLWSQRLSFASIITWIIAMILSIIGILKIYRKYDKELYHADLEYYREVPTAYGPAVARLVQDSNSNLDQTQLIATLFNLYIKKYIDLQLLEKSKKKTEINIILLKSIEEANANLDPIDYDLFNWLVKDFGEAQSKTYEAFLGANSKSERVAKKFINRYDAFIGNIELEYRKLDHQIFAGRHQKMPFESWLPFILYLILGVITALLLFLNKANFILAIVIASHIFLLLFIIAIGYEYKNNCYQLTKEGTDERAICQGLKNYLNDYSMLNEAPPTAIHLWEKYFVYGLALGVTEKALNKLYEKMPQAFHESSDFMTLYMMNQLYYRHHLISYSTNRINTMTERIHAAEVSRSSGGSSHGGGGGFSGGGGFGGGGGGSSSF